VGYTEKTITSLGLIIAGILGIVVAIFVLSPTPTVSALALTPGELGAQWVFVSGPEVHATPSLTLNVTGAGAVTANFGVSGDDTNITALALGAMTPSGQFQPDNLRSRQRHDGRHPEHQSDSAF